MKDPRIIAKSPKKDSVGIRLRVDLWNLVEKYLNDLEDRRFRLKKKKITHSEYIENLIVKDLRERKLKGELDKIDNELINILDRFKLEKDIDY